MGKLVELQCMPSYVHVLHMHFEKYFGIMSYNNIKGFRPEWYISTICHFKDILFWLETLDIVLLKSSFN